ncbi:signal peptide peptidase SppA [Nannocystis sp.]|uniref:signal peptide peptidase SppA n=1 Tax=Nannocystis sp. TaxID=1962667 RepID=UPI0025EAE40C|nr:signal peptide peptidase SppA [Nannocystis sp.]MBK7823740.1 signal peptide peptidase SppA [Nannocystis sp.]
MMKRWMALSLSLPLLLAACNRGERGATADAPKPASSEPKDAPAPAPAANPLGALGPLAGMMASKLEQPGPYDAPIKSADFNKDAPHFLTYELHGAIDDLSQINLFGGGGGVTELRALTDRLHRAAADPNVRGLVLRVDAPEIDMASAEDLRAAMLAFKGPSGARKLHCHADSAGNLAYFLLSACDRVGLEPLGELALTGPAATPIHLKGLLDRLGVQPDFVHVGAFKGAAEPLTRREPSPEMLATLGAIVDQMYASLIAGLVEGRGLTRESAVETIDKAMYFGESAVAAKLVDVVTPWESFRDEATGGTAWSRMKLKESAGAGGFDIEKLQVFLGLLPTKRPSDPHVALVYAVGNIIDGKGGGLIGARREIAGHTLSAALHNLAADDKVRAIVLRVNSGGGSAQASEEIWRAVAAVKAKKPVIVSMGRVAASGGYYISTGATKIFAQPDTLTGSIGVVGGKLALGGMLAKIGVETFAVGRGKHATMWSAMTPWTDEQRAMVLGMMEDVYKVFVNRVAEGRGKAYDEIHAIAQGRVWTGKAAQERGLVDAMGDLDAALAEARTLAQVGPTVELEVYPPEPTLKDVLEGLVEASPADMLGRAEVVGALAQLRAEFGHGAVSTVVATLGQLLQLRREPVLMATMLPLTVE